MNDTLDITVMDKPTMTPAVVSADQMGVIEARIRSEYQVRTALALGRPRDMDEVRERILKDCKRPGFAAVAEYSLPRGGKTINGPSVRFADAALSALGNIAAETNVIREDETERTCEVVLTDLERNTTVRQGFIVSKISERRNLPPNVRNDDILGTRVNADGVMLYMVKVGENDILMKQNNTEARIRRNLILRLLPGDIKDEALDLCRTVRQNADAADPDAARKKLLDNFALIGVNVAALKAYIGHDPATCSPSEMDDLRKLYAGIRSGDTTWTEVMAGLETAAAKKADPAMKAAEAVKAKLAGGGAA